MEAGHLGPCRFQAGDGEEAPGASWGARRPSSNRQCWGGQVVRTPPPILCVWLVHEAVAAGVIKEMYANFQLG